MGSDSVAGAQVVARAVQLLKLVSERSVEGHLIADLVSRSGLTRPTVYRLLSALQATGLVEQSETSKRWYLGPEAFVLGTLSAGRFNIERLAHDALIRIADETGESAFLSIRRGNESVCLIREEGTYPIRTHVLQPGDRLPLGVGSAGMAILAALSDDELQESLEISRDILRSQYVNYSPKLIAQGIDETRQLKYSVNRGLLLAGSWGMAAAVADRNGRPVAALSITGVESRLGGKRQPELGRLLVREAKLLELLLNSDRKT